MNKEQYIRSRFKDLLNETLEERANDIKMNLSKKQQTQSFVVNEAPEKMEFDPRNVLLSNTTFTKK